MSRGMQNKTIKKALSKKMNDWLLTITDEEVRKQAANDVIVTGGSIASMIMGDPINDYDVYFRTYETTLAVAEYYCKVFRESNNAYGLARVETHQYTNKQGECEKRVSIMIPSSGILQEDGHETEEESDGDEPVEAVEDTGEKYRPVFISENAITLSHSIQIITRFFGSPEKIHENFDFVHATCYYDHNNDELFTPEAALRSMQSMTLLYQGSLFPICSIFRTRKFIERGWKISAGEMLKMAFQVSELDLSDIAVLRDQLCGVDALYFNMLIQALEGASIEELNSQYVIAVIDRIFGE